MISTPPSTAMAGRVQHADGTIGYTGSIGFDVHSGAMGIIGSILRRYVTFNVGINDGYEDWEMNDCKATSLSVSGSAGGLIAAQLSFMSLNAKTGGSTPHTFLRNSEPAGFWYSGVGTYNVMDWNFSMNQDATFVYRNRASGGDDGEQPGYIKVGNISYSLTVNLFEEYYPSDPTAGISIVTSNFTLTGRTTGKGFSYGGPTGIGSYSYTFETSSQTGSSDGLVFS
jgi:hypothetical protein